MILLTTPTSTLAIVTGGAQAIDVHASFVTLNGSTVTPGDLNTQISSGTTTTIVTGPAAGQLAVKYVNVRNNDGAVADTVTVQHFDGTTTVNLISLSLTAGYQLSYNEDNGWEVSDTNGAIQYANA
jgi:hypothetical protein